MTDLQYQRLAYKPAIVISKLSKTLAARFGNVLGVVELVGVA